jgi:NAD(P)-dependent dehydrogenase (short-subunit alcohol dehydrogenase family)
MTKNNKLQGKVAVITGGTTGIGLATAKLFAKEGAYVFITGRRQKELDAAVKAIGANVTGVQGDIAKLADLDRLYEAVKTKGRIDVVFANAGVAEFAPMGKITEEHSAIFPFSDRLTESQMARIGRVLAEPRSVQMLRERSRPGKNRCRALGCAKRTA